MTVESERGGARPVTLTYLTPGLGWAADYVALFDESAGRMDVQGWITLTNNSGTPFTTREHAARRRRGRPGPAGPAISRPAPAAAACAACPGTETGDRERLGDFYLYPLPERTTIANRQTKQVSFLDVSGTPARGL